MSSVLWTDTTYDITNFLLSLVYLLLFLLGPTLYVHCMDQVFWKEFASLTFLCFFELGIFVRGVYFALQPLVREDKLQLANSVNFLINTVPSFFFFTTYMVILLLWGQIFVRKRGGNRDPSGSEESFLVISTKTKRSNYKELLIGPNVVMYLVISVLYGLDLYSSGATDQEWTRIAVAKSTFEDAVLCVAVFMYISITFAFFVYGYLVYRKDHAELETHTSKHRQQLLRRIGLLGLICMFCFLVRAVLTVLQMKIKVLAQTWWVFMLYYLLLEILPLSLMLSALLAANAPPPRPSRNSPGQPRLNLAAPLIA